MNTKQILVAAVLAVLLVCAGLFATRDTNASAANASGAGELFLPGLLDSINSVSELAIKTTAGEFHVKSQDGTWVLAEKDGYPVQIDNVRSTLLALAELKTVEEKTDLPKNHVLLGVQSVGADPGAETQSKQVDLLDASGGTLASIILGKTRSGGQGNTFYVRRPSEMTSWLVEGKLPTLPDDGEAWLDKQVIEIQRDDVRAVQTTHADGEVLTISKHDSDTDFTVHNLPADRELTYDAVAGGIAGALQYVNFEDVMKADSFEAPDAPVAVTSFWTRDGMRLAVQVWEKDGQTFAAFAASYDPGGTPELEVGPMPEPAEGEAIADAAPRAQAEVEAEAADINARLAPWVFQLPSYSQANLTKRMDGLLKPLPEPEETTPEIDPDAPIDIDSLGDE